MQGEQVEKSGEGPDGGGYSVSSLMMMMIFSTSSPPRRSARRLVRTVRARGRGQPYSLPKLYNPGLFGCLFSWQHLWVSHSFAGRGLEGHGLGEVCQWETQGEQVQKSGEGPDGRGYSVSRARWWEFLWSAVHQEDHQGGSSGPLGDLLLAILHLCLGKKGLSYLPLPSLWVSQISTLRMRPVCGPALLHGSSYLPILGILNGLSYLPIPDRPAIMRGLSYLPISGVLLGLSYLPVPRLAKRSASSSVSGSGGDAHVQALVTSPGMEGSTGWTLGDPQQGFMADDPGHAGDGTAVA